MAEKKIAVKHVQRNDTQANWLLSNPTLLNGEIGIETDTGKLKVGNGVDKYSDLPYFTLSLDDIATESKNGLMSSEDKAKLNAIAKGATKVEASTTNGKIKINGTETTVYTHPSGTNPHGTTKSDVGLGNVDNTSDLNKPISTATQKALDAKANSSHTHTKSQITDFPTSLPANGGDADTVDGKHASDFATASHTHSYLPLSGGTLTGALSTNSQIKSTVATGTAPFTVASTTAVTNLNADMLDGKHASDFATSTHTHDDRYYTETEIDTKLGTKADSSHTHTSANISDATNANTANTIVKRDASGNFSAGTITASLSGNASTASKWATARTLTLTGGVTGSASIDGSGNVSLATTLAGHNQASNTITAMTGYAKASAVSAIATTDTLNTAIGKLEKALDSKQASGSYASSSHTHNYAGSSSAGGSATSALTCTGNSATATKLQTARTINGTSFNGSANITTANWGTARTLTIGNTGKSVNGSGNVSWSLAEIGALPLADSWKNEPKKIPANADLNTYYTSGVYSSDSDGNSQTIVNRPPETVGFVLYVNEIYGSGVSGRQIQTATVRGSNNVYIRSKPENDSWTAWTKLYSSTSKPTPADIGASASNHTHDDRYYTETEINTKLSGKSDTTHTHTDLLKKVIQVPSGTHVNTCYETGIYKCVGWVGYPSGVLDAQGTLIVTNYEGNCSTGWVEHEFITPHRNNRYFGVYVNGKWSGWQEVATTSSTLPITGGTVTGNIMINGTTDLVGNVGCNGSVYLKVDGSPVELNSYLSALNAKASTGTIKSVQRGWINNPTASQTASVSISTVNSAKCIVIINGAGAENVSNFCGGYMPTLVSLTNTSFTYCMYNETTWGKNKYAALSWQVIEFY